MKVLITGASGFVGGAVMRRAQELGWDVCGIGRRAMADKNYVSIDLRRPLDLDFKPEVVIHAAARSSPWGRQRDFEADNVTATQHLLDFCAARGQPHLVHISTGAVLYRKEHQFAMDEQCPFPDQPVNEYARTKLRSELLVRDYPGTWSILRPRAVFGPGDTVVFPRILRALERGRLPLIQSDQPAVGDVVFIDTLTDYILRAAERRARGVYHVTNNQPVEIYAFLNQICRGLGLSLPARKVTAAKAMRAAHLVEIIYGLLPFLGEPPVTRFGVSVFAYSKTFNVARTLRDLGPPSVSLEDGLAKFIAWQLTQKKTFALSRNHHAPKDSGAGCGPLRERRDDSVRSLNPCAPAQGHKTRDSSGQ